ncbi:hypothetical protein [Chromobacterium subtsugae]|uniref:hypothetical protein n=1 Tax=Chromobacterium subtsugae TaxID=251747 RepID=UPI0006410742|nr:hypothetical protein [Chromobacterium subtsugae]
MTVQGYAVLYLAFIIVLFAALVWKTPILRDRGPLAPGVADGQQTFSLARSQLLWWTLSVALVAGWLLIVTGNLLSSTPQVLALLGISAGTSGLASLVDQPDGGAQAAALGRSRGWVRDVLDDGQGISVHRYQALLANAGIGLVFIYKSVELKAFYAIDPMWLGVLGVSSVLYVGMKSRETAAVGAGPLPALALAQPQAAKPGNTPPALQV